jgi:hypothetical protein
MRKIKGMASMERIMEMEMEAKLRRKEVVGLVKSAEREKIMNMY